jgi:hypothetical protein
MRGLMKPCRDCGREISEQAFSCPGCGAPFPARQQWDGGVGFEYRSRLTVAGLPLVHVSFKYRNRAPVVAKGWLAIGQFAVGGLTISQFGIGIVSVSQFTVAGWALAQFGIAWSLVAQMGIFLHDGRGQMVRGLLELFHLLR